MSLRELVKSSAIVVTALTVALPIAANITAYAYARFPSHGEVRTKIDGPFSYTAIHESGDYTEIRNATMLNVRSYQDVDGDGTLDTITNTPTGFDMPRSKYSRVDGKITRSYAAYFGESIRLGSDEEVEQILDDADKEFKKELRRFE